MQNTLLKEKDAIKQAEERLFNEGAGVVLNYIASGMSDGDFLKINNKDRLKIKLYTCISRNFRVLYERFASEVNVKENTGCRPETCCNSPPTGLYNAFNSIFSTGNIVTGKYKSGMDSLISFTDNLLGSNGGGSGGDNYAIIKCVFKNNEQKPENVTELNTVINIFGSALIIPGFRYGITIGYLINEVIIPHVINALDESQFTGSNIQNIVNNFEISPAEIDMQLICDDIEKLLDADTICLNIFKKAVDLLALKLDKTGMGYQYIDYRMNDYEAEIREYWETEKSKLPDENFSIKLRCLTSSRLFEERRYYDGLLENIKVKTGHLEKLIEVIYRDSKSIFRVNDFEDLAKKNKNRMQKLINNGTENDTGYGSIEESCVCNTGVKQLTPKLLLMREKFKKMQKSMYPVERKVMEERLDLLENEFSSYNTLLNPHQLKPGILLDVSVTSIKRKKTTLDSMIKVLTEFLAELSRLSCP